MPEQNTTVPPNVPDELQNNGVRKKDGHYFDGLEYCG